MTAHDALLEELRPRAFAIAYRMLGSVADAQDIVQDALLRVHTVLARGERIESPFAYIATVTTRLAIDELRSARSRREAYVGEWLPEPIVSETANAPDHQHEMAESLSMAFLVLLETLSPEQRAALLLREIFDYAYADVAAIVGTSEVNARQLVARARRHVAARRPRFETTPERGEELARRFYAAAQDGDLEALESLLAEDVALHGDGGGRAPAPPKPVRGRERVARTVAAWATVSRSGSGFSRRAMVNGQPGLIGRDANGGVVSVMALHIERGLIHELNVVSNPDKLRHLGPVGDLHALIRAAGARTRQTARPKPAPSTPDRASRTP